MRADSFIGLLLVLPVLVGGCHPKPAPTPSPKVAESKAAGIPRHARAFAVVVDRANVERVSAGAHVDVLATVPFGDAGMATVTVLGNVIVREVRDDPSHRRAVVTLLVLPEEAELLAQAQTVGTLQLSVRNPESLDVGRDTVGKVYHRTDKDLIHPPN